MDIFKESVLLRAIEAVEKLLIKYGSTRIISYIILVTYMSTKPSDLGMIISALVWAFLAVSLHRRSHSSTHKDK